MEPFRAFEPNLVISQGMAKSMRDTGICRNVEKGIAGIEEIPISGTKALLLKFTHPSTPNHLGWGNGPRDKYLLETVKPTVGEAMRRLLAQ